MKLKSLNLPLTGLFAPALLFLLALTISNPGFGQARAKVDGYKTIHVKFKEEFEPKGKADGASSRSGMASVDRVSEKHKALSIKRIFPDAGKYELAHKAFGLHLWYEIKFKKDVMLKEAVADYQSLNYFYNVEESKEYTAGWDRTSTQPELPSGTNDPRFTDQWHYNNTGQSGGVVGADINLLKAWQIETGSPEVIVAVIDGGISQNHPDLVDALWTNTGEIPQNGIDDDHNGYTDDYHGYSFGDESSVIYADGHGSHVAGTIGAVSNNGIGVSGIAGGSGAGDGVRLMSCAAFGHFDTGGFEQAMVYAADNGAVISQNSWGGGSTSIEAAINYFVTRAGYDNTSANFSKKIQTGPMAGGLVIFAAGNSNTSDTEIGYPASYSKVMAVASTDDRDIKSYFSNYGGWVDISAPGSYIVSTYSTGYETLSGTSMACPHVSGVAALVVSNIQHEGLKAAEVWDRLKSSARNINAKNPSKIGMLGAGRIDAYVALRERDDIDPGTIIDLHAKEIHHSNTILQWTATGENGNEGGPSASYEIRYSMSPITESNFNSAILVWNPPVPPAIGEQVTLDVRNLAPLTTYYFAIKSKDIFYNTSVISNVLSVTTVSPPVLVTTTTNLAEALYTGEISSRSIMVTNTGGDELRLKLTISEATVVPADWLKIVGGTIVIAPGDSVELPVTFSATGLSTGLWTAYIHLISLNLSARPPTTIPVALHVTSAADLETTHAIDFGTQFLGFAIDSIVSIKNKGYLDLVISDIHSNDSRVIVSLSSVTVMPGQDLPLSISVVPTEAGTIDATVTFTSNDPDEGVITLPIHTEVLMAPSIEVNPDSLSAALAMGEIKTLNFTATNTGGSVLHWKANFGSKGLTIGESSVQQSSIQSAAASQSSVGEFSLKASSPSAITCLSFDPKGGFIYAKSISGNAFYRYNTATDSWATVGTAPGGIVGQTAYLDGKIYHVGSQLSIYTIETNSWLSVSFPVAGSSTLSLTTDGQYLYVTFLKTLHRYDPVANSWLQLANLPSGGLSNFIQSLSYQGGTIYAHEGSGITGDGNTPFLKYDITSDTWIKSGVSIPGKADCSAIDPVARNYFSTSRNPAIEISILDLREGTFVKKSAPFVFQQPSLLYVGNPGISGIYFVQGNYGNAFARYETAPLNDWVSVTPTQGDLMPGATQTFNVNVNGDLLSGGTYTGDIHVSSDHPPIDAVVPVTVTVTASPDISLSKTTADATTVIGNKKGVSVIIKNIGSTLLTVDSVIIDNPEFSISKTSFSIPSGESTSVIAYFKPTTIGLHEGKFIFHNNDPDEDSVQFILNGTCVTSHISGIDVDSLHADLITGAKSVQNITISNTGGDVMGYLIDSNPRGGWLKGSLQGYLKAGETMTFPITMDASGKTAGTYVGKIIFEHYGLSEFVEQIIEIPVSMTVTDATDILTSTASINFGDKFINNTHDGFIYIKNNGVLPLSITAIESNNPVFSITATAPLTLAPDETVSATIQFSPDTAGIQEGTITFTSNDPDESDYVITVSGNGVIPPVLQSNVTELVVTAYSDEPQTQTLNLSNAGGSMMTWKILEQANPVPTASGGALPSTAGGFTQRSSPPNRLISLAKDPATGLLYAHKQYIYVYSPSANTWTQTATIADGTSAFVNGGAVILNSKMYCTYTEDSSKIYVYDLALMGWTTRPNELGSGTGNITTDGTLLYLAGGGKFKSYNPSSKVWTDLPIPSITLDGAGGLRYHNGIIYAHAGQSTGFVKYTIATGVWENLAPLPDNAVLGSALDPVRNRYYAYGKNGSSYFYEYDIAANLWTVLSFSLFELGDGGMEYTSQAGYEGVYFLQGTPGKAFARYEPKAELSWLRSSPLLGEVSVSDNQSIAIKFNGAHLTPGSYHGNLHITSNDPAHLTHDIPVTYNVLNPAPFIGVPTVLADTADRPNPYVTYLKITNSGRNPLEWNLVGSLPSSLTASQSSGTVSGLSADSIQLTFNPNLFTQGRMLDYFVSIHSNDLEHPTVKTRLNFVLSNAKPLLSTIFPDTVLTTENIQLPLLGFFSDPDNDALSFTATSSINAYVRVGIANNQLTIRPYKPGTAVITVNATDAFGSTTTTTFNATVEVITGTDDAPQPEVKFTASPNPFEGNVTIHFGGYDSGNGAIVLFDLTGKPVYTLNGIDLTTQHEVDIDATNLPTGLYMCVLSVNNKFVKSIRVLKGK